MECRPVCPAHTNYIEWFLIPILPTYGNKSVLDWVFLKKIRQPQQRDCPWITKPYCLFWHQYMVYYVNYAIALINIFDCNSGPAACFIL